MHFVLSVPSFWQQEGLDDGPDFLSEEDRGVSCLFVFLKCISLFTNPEAFLDVSFMHR